MRLEMEMPPANGRTPASSGARVAVRATAVLGLAVLLSITGGGDSFGPSPGFEFNHDEVELALGMASAVYCQSHLERLVEWNCSRCRFVKAKVVAVIDTGSATGINEGLQSMVVAVPSRQKIVVAFRGTSSSSARNWWTDLSLGRSAVSKHFKLGPGCDQKAQAHHGFLNAYSALKAAGLWGNITTALKTYPSYSVLATGHSLGAAIAVFAAMEITVTAGKPCDLVTFGETRVGDSKFATCTNTTLLPNATRFVHHHDLVPMLPPRASGYVHRPREMWLQSENTTLEQVIVCDGSGEDPKCENSIPISQASINDHYFYLGTPLEGSDPKNGFAC